jgi:hypothetical protein
MSVVPQCPVHQSAMRESDKKPGSFYCSKKVGPNYCTWKQAEDGRQYQYPKPTNEAPKPAAAPQIQTTWKQEPAPTSSESDVRLWLAALDFAASVHHGSGNTAEALSCASAARALLP